MSAFFRSSSCLACVAVVALPLQAFAFPPQVVEFQISPADRAQDDQFGRSVALDAGTAVVGAPFDDDFQTDAGSAYVWVRNGVVSWAQQAKLTASDAGAGDNMGQQVAISGNTAVISAHLADVDDGSGSVLPDAGRALVFVRSGSAWSRQAELAPMLGATNARFSQSVAVHADTAVIGAPGAGGNVGAAYAFERSGTVWTERSIPIPSPHGGFDLFGQAVAVLGNTIVVGAPNYDLLGESSGAVFVYERGATEWTQAGPTLTASDGASQDNFGYSLALDGDTLVIGSTAQRAYVFVKEDAGWVEQDQLVVDGGGLSFGFSVGLSGDRAVVGSYYGGTGAAYLFERLGSSWSLLQLLVPSDGFPSDQFGWSVDADGETVLVGSRLNDHYFDFVGYPDAGSAYAYEVTPVVEVAIDIKPGDPMNTVNLATEGVMRVAILTTRVADGDAVDFDVGAVHQASVTLAGAPVLRNGSSSGFGVFADVDGDGDRDLVQRFPIGDMELTGYETHVILEGQTFNRTPFAGRDAIRNVAP